MLAKLKDILAIAKEGAIIGFVLLFFIAPQWIGDRLVEAGFNKVNFLGMERNLTQQLDREVATLNLVDEARIAAERAARQIAGAGQAPDQLAAQLQQLGQTQQTLQRQVAQTARAVRVIDPAAVPTEGWIYLGTMDPQTRAWKPDASPALTRTTTLPPSSIRPGEEITLRTQVNLRGGPPDAASTPAPVVTVLQAGQAVTIREVTTSVRAPEGAPDAPGFRVWARVSAVASRGGG
jgi:hypothetical protein